MSWYGLVKVLHIIAVIMLVGGLFARQLVRRHASKTNDVKVFETLSNAAGRIENVLVIPGGQATFLLGVILALMGGAPILGFLLGSSQNWLLISNILIVSTLVLVPTIFIPRGRKFEPLLQAALAKGEITTELHAAMEDGIVKLAHIYEEVSVIAIVALMVLKPF